MPTEKQLTQHQVLKKLVISLVKNDIHSLVAYGSAGLGKTETILTQFNEMGFKEGNEFLYLNNYITPLSLYNTLQEVNELADPKILILDDCDFIFAQKIIISILKGALWTIPPYNNRKVCWQSPRADIKEFNFQGKIIILLNQIDRDNPTINAMADRGYYYEITFTRKEIINMIRERAKRDYKGIPFKQRKKIADFIAEIGLGCKYLSLRTLIQGYQLFLSSPHHYQELLTKTLK